MTFFDWTKNMRRYNFSNGIVADIFHCNSIQFEDTKTGNRVFIFAHAGKLFCGDMTPYYKAVTLQQVIDYLIDKR